MARHSDRAPRLVALELLRLSRAGELQTNENQPMRSHAALKVIAQFNEAYIA
jgi:hypothetical protein